MRGKPGIEKPGINVSVWMDLEQLESLDRLAAKVGVSRSKMAGNLLKMGLDDAKTLDAWGIIPAALALRKFKEVLMKKAEPDAEAVRHALMA